MDEDEMIKELEKKLELAKTEYRKKICSKCGWRKKSDRGCEEYIDGLYCQHLENAINNRRDIKKLKNKLLGVILGDGLLLHKKKANDPNRVASFLLSDAEVNAKSHINSIESWRGSFVYVVDTLQKVGCLNGYGDEVLKSLKTIDEERKHCSSCGKREIMMRQLCQSCYNKKSLKRRLRNPKFKAEYERQKKENFNKLKLEKKRAELEHLLWVKLNVKPRKKTLAETNIHDRQDADAIDFRINEKEMEIKEFEKEINAKNN